MSGFRIEHSQGGGGRRVFSFTGSVHPANCGMVSSSAFALVETLRFQRSRSCQWLIGHIPLIPNLELWGGRGYIPERFCACVATSVRPLHHHQPRNNLAHTHTHTLLSHCSSTIDYDIIKQYAVIVLYGTSRYTRIAMFCVPLAETYSTTIVLI